MIKNHPESGLLIDVDTKMMAGFDLIDVRFPTPQVNPPGVFGDSIFWKGRDHGTTDTELQP